MNKITSNYPILILFRHGQTNYNAEKRFQGQINCPLNENGLSQALQTGEHVSQILKMLLDNKNSNSKIIECLTSDLERAFETSQIVSRIVLKENGIQLKFKETKVLREYHAGDLANYTLSEFNEKYPGVMDVYFKNYQKDPWDTRYPGCESESWNMVSQRVSTELKKINLNFINFQTSNLNSEVDPMSFAVAKSIYIWSTHGGIIGNLMRLMNVKQIEGGRTCGNGDVLVLIPLVNYKEQVLNNKPNISNNLLNDSQFPFEQSIKHECFVSWKILKHVKVGDAITALSDLRKYAIV